MDDADFKRPFRWFGLGFMALGLFMGLLFVVLALAIGSVGSHTVETTGTVIKVVENTGWDVDRRETTTTWWSTLEYEVDGRTYYTATPAKLPVGSTLTIYYEPDDPTQGHTTPQNTATVLWILAAALGLPFLGTGLAIWLWARSRPDWPVPVSPRGRTGGSWRWGALPTLPEPTQSDVSRPPDDSEPTQVPPPDVGDGTFPSYPTQATSSDPPDPRNSEKSNDPDPSQDLR